MAEGTQGKPPSKASKPSAQNNSASAPSKNTTAKSPPTNNTNLTISISLFVHDMRTLAFGASSTEHRAR